MAARLLPNLCPNDVQLSAINKLIEQQKDLINAIETVKKKNEERHAQLSENALVFQRTFQSTETLSKITTQMSVQITDWIERLDMEILVQELGQTLLSSPAVPSTVGFIEGWKAVQKAATAFSSILKDHMASMRDRTNSVLEQLHTAETLRDETARTLTGLSTMTETSHSIIKATYRGILHPLRRLPPEILLQIFEECVEDEVDDLHLRLLTAPGLSRMPITLASVCRTWRRTVLCSPRLWGYIRLPLHKRVVDAAGCMDYGYIGNDFVERARGSAIEVTVHGGTSAVEAELTNINTRRLNIANVGSVWPPPSSIPSPAHLWLGYRGSLIIRTIPSTLVSRTTRITCLNVFPEFEAPAKPVEDLLLEGRWATLALTPLLGNLPGLKSLDLANLVLTRVLPSTIQNLRHSRLVSLAIHASALPTLERSLADGLRLPSIGHLSLNGLISMGSSPPVFPLTSSQLSTTVTKLEFREATAKDCIRFWVDALTTVDTISIRGDNVQDVLSALYYDSGNPEDLHINRSMPKGIKTLTLHEYKFDGTAIFQQLRDICGHPEPDTGVIKVVFDGCVNIARNIREGLSRGPPFPDATVSGSEDGCQNQ